MAQLTNRQKVLIAALTLEEQGFVPFSIEQLTVVAWASDQKMFGLKGYETVHPDNNHVATYLFGPRGLKRAGYVRPQGPRQYVLTEDGRLHAKASLETGERMRTVNARSEARVPCLNPTQSKRIKAIMASPAYRRAAGGLYDMTSPGEAVSLICEWDMFLRRRPNGLSPIGYRLTEWSANRTERLSGEHITKEQLDRIRQVVEKYKARHKPGVAA